MTNRNRHFVWIGVLLMTLAVAACNKKDSTTTPTPTPDPPPATYTVSGNVTNGTSPLPGVSVRITGGTGSNFGKTATTDSGGNYSITGVSPERITMEASLAGYSIGSASPTVSGNTSQNFTITRLTFTISGTVTDSTSKGVLPNILVKIVGGTSPNFGKEATTNGSGQYSISGVVAERIILEASNSAYLPGSVSPTIAGNATIDFVLDRLTVVAGSIVFQIDSASCGLTPSSPIVDAFIDGVNVATIYNVTTPNSRATRAVVPGPHTVQATGSRGASYPLTNVNVTSGSTVNIPLVCTS